MSMWIWRNEAWLYLCTHHFLKKTLFKNQKIIKIEAWKKIPSILDETPTAWNENTSCWKDEQQFTWLQRHVLWTAVKSENSWQPAMASEAGFSSNSYFFFHIQSLKCLLMGTRIYFRLVVVRLSICQSEWDLPDSAQIETAFCCLARESHRRMHTWPWNPAIGFRERRGDPSHTGAVALFMLRNFLLFRRQTQFQPLGHHVVSSMPGNLPREKE